MNTNTEEEWQATINGAQAPRCRMCAKPARWNAKHQHYGMYCAGSSCNNHIRLCQSCDQPFFVGAREGGGTKYCSADCKVSGSSAVKTYSGQVTHKAVKCAWCDSLCEPRSTRTGFWPHICIPCIDPIRHLVDRLKKHHVPANRARQLLTATGCDICGRDIVTKVRDSRSGKVQALLVVDHDHKCCPTSTYSCGRCIRGFLCPQCNTAIGMLGNSANLARAMALYLEVSEFITGVPE